MTKKLQEKLKGADSLKLSYEQMKEVDSKVPEQYGITVSRMMENAGYQIADFIRQEIEEEKITVYAGKGNNGGDALVAARRLHFWGYKIEIVLATEELDGIRKEELEILKDLGAEVNLESSENSYSVAIEGLIGYNLKGNPRTPFDSMIKEINDFEKIVSIDIASGLNADTGEKGEPCVRPDFTITLAAPFKGMSKDNSGRVFVADIGVPPEAFEKFGFTVELFDESSLVELDL